MNNNWLNISGKISEPFISIYALVAEIAAQNNLPFFIIGATARDLIFEHAYGIKAPRATKDIDLAVQVANWQDFERLKSQLMATGKFTGDKQSQRLRYHDVIPVDIVPFGGIEANGNISWPPEYSIEMTAAGFQEAHSHAQIVRLRENPALDVHVVTPAGLMILKLIAWNDRYPQAQKDALDIAFILRHTIGPWNREQLYDHYIAFIEAEDYDETHAGARMLGQEMAKMLTFFTRQLISEILLKQVGEQARYRLIEDMLTAPEQFEQNLELLEALNRGLQDGLSKP
jgi:predicted nucleotidyltransferase